MSIIIFGVSHKTAPIDVRERVTVGANQLPAALASLRASGTVDEALILSTCNRTEVYSAGTGNDSNKVADWLIDFKGLDPTIVNTHFYDLDGALAIKHTLNVACGLDSMVVGEPQILGQLKSAYRSAVTAGTVGRALNKLLQYAFSVAKKVRTETTIGHTPVSVAYAAVRLAGQIHGNLATKTALLIGAGDTIALVAAHLRANSIRSIVIANRTVARSVELAEKVDGTAITLNDISAHLPAADIVVSSTGSELPIISRGAVANAVAARHHDPIFLVDLAVPRDIAPEVAQIDDAYLYTVDDLNNVINENLELRAGAAAQAEEIVSLHTQAYLDRMQADDGNAALITYRNSAHNITAALLDKAARRIAAGDDPLQVMEQLARGLTNKLIHRPTVKLREALLEGRFDFVEHAHELLDLRQQDNKDR